MRQLACILIALAIAGVYGDEPDKLVNGIPTTIEKNPHCVSLRIKNSHFCGGSIIDEKFILTAGHCVALLVQNPSLKQQATVVTGTTYLNSGGQHYEIKNVWYHDNYNPRALGRGPYDLGLIELTGPIQFDEKTQPIKLPTKDVKKGDSVTIAAWGSTGFRKTMHNELQKLNAGVMLPNECQTYHSLFMRIHQKNEFCTLIKKGVGLCNGDSGSGLYDDETGCIVGLVSGGRPCAEGYPDVYTKVYPYISWINEKMGK
ncbi:PREDICTED: chymotrypsin-1-like [Wasmannia auropunctata]|uniref:chymotrypsin-1-like n=1 Tax=Wasmannia auropunctata TaxID=64793 RepID=UPI0005EDE35D|nr:PREDICTED: chymotrypsin-1-like [Wasmannia auropunctata]